MRIYPIPNDMDANGQPCLNTHKLYDCVIKLPGISEFTYYIPRKKYPRIFYESFTADIAFLISVIATLWGFWECITEIDVMSIGLLMTSILGAILSFRDIEAFEEWDLDNCSEISNLSYYLFNKKKKDIWEV